MKFKLFYNKLNITLTLKVAFPSFIGQVCLWGYLFSGVRILFVRSLKNKVGNAENKVKTFTLTKIRVDGFGFRPVGKFVKLFNVQINFNPFFSPAEFSRDVSIRKLYTKSQKNCFLKPKFITNDNFHTLNL